MKHLIAALLILASLGVADEGKALEFKRPPTLSAYAVNYGKAASPAVIYVALPLAYICTNDYEYRDMYIYRGGIETKKSFPYYQDAPLPIRNSGTFDTVVYVGYFVVSQPPEQKIPHLTWHPAPEFSAPVYQEPVLKSVANDMAMLPQRMADFTTREEWESKELLRARWWWDTFFWELFPNTVILGKPGDPPNPTWRPRFEGSFKTSCAKILAADLSREELLEKFVTGNTLLNPLPGMKVFKARLLEDF